MPKSAGEEHTFNSHSNDRPVTPGPNAFARKRAPTPTQAISPQSDLDGEMYIPDTRPQSRSQSRAEARRVDPVPYYGSPNYENNETYAHFLPRAHSRANSPRRPNTASTTTSSNKSTTRVQFALEGNERISPTDSDQRPSPSEMVSYEEKLKLIPSPDPNKPAAPTARKSIEERKEQRLMELIRNGGSTLNASSSGIPIANIHDASVQKRRHIPSPLKLAPVQSETQHHVDNAKPYDPTGNLHINTTISTRGLIPPDPSPSPKKRFMNILRLGGPSTLKSSARRQELKESRTPAQVKVPRKAAQLLGARTVSGDNRVAPTVARWAHDPETISNTWSSPSDGVGLGITGNDIELRREFGMSSEADPADQSGRSKKSTSAPRERERASDEVRAGIRNRPATVHSKSNPRAKGPSILKESARATNANDVEALELPTAAGQDAQNTDRRRTQYEASDIDDDVEETKIDVPSQTSMTLSPTALQFYDNESPPTPPSKSTIKVVNKTSNQVESRPSVGEGLPSTTYSLPSSPSKNDRVGVGNAGYVSQAKLVETTPNAHSMCALVEDNEVINTPISSEVTSPVQMGGVNQSIKRESVSGFTPTARHTKKFREMTEGVALVSPSIYQDSLDSAGNKSSQPTPSLFPTPLKPDHVLRERRAFHSLHRHYLEEDNLNGPAKKDSPITPSAGYVPLMLDPDTRRKLLLEGKISPEPALRPSTDTLDTEDEIDDIAAAYIQLDVDLIRNVVHEAVYKAEVRAEESRSAKYYSILCAIDGVEKRIENLRAELQEMKTELSRVPRQDENSSDSTISALCSAKTPTKIQKPLPNPLIRASPRRNIDIQQEPLQSPASPTSPMYSVATSAQLTGRNRGFESTAMSSPSGQSVADFRDAEKDKAGKFREAAVPANAGQREEKTPKRTVKRPSNGNAASGRIQNTNSANSGSPHSEASQQQLRQSVANSYFAQLERNRAAPDLNRHPAWRGY